MRSARRHAASAASQAFARARLWRTTPVPSKLHKASRWFFEASLRLSGATFPGDRGPRQAHEAWMSVSTVDTDIQESRRRCLSSMYKCPFVQSRKPTAARRKAALPPKYGWLAAPYRCLVKCYSLAVSCCSNSIPFLGTNGTGVSNRALVPLTSHRNFAVRQNKARPLTLD